jgi:predicted PurR-regulated permease PerM
MNLSFQKLFYAIATVFAFFAILILAKMVLIPMAFSLLIAFILFPVARKFEVWGTSKIMGATLSMLSLFLLLGGGIFLFSTQIIQLSDNLSDFKDKIIGVLADVSVYINNNISSAPHLEKGELYDKLKSWLSESAGRMANQTFSGGISFLTGLLSIIIFTFLILIYRNGLVRAFTHFYRTEDRENAVKMFKSVQQVGQKYLFGIFMIVIILGLVNSIGLWIIGIDNPFLFGFLAAVLAIIPYVGTIAGAAIPVLYSFMTHDSVWMPIAIAIFFWLVQVVESNFLTPKIVGGNLKVNALAAILCIIIGASVWGIAGMILFLPFTAMLKVVCEEYTELKPIALMIGDQMDNKSNEGDEFINKVYKKIKKKKA